MKHLNWWSSAPGPVHLEGSIIKEERGLPDLPELNLPHESQSQSYPEYESVAEYNGRKAESQGRLDKSDEEENEDMGKTQEDPMLIEDEESTEVPENAEDSADS